MVKQSVTFWLDPSTGTLDKLDYIRGHLNRSKAIRILLDHILDLDPNFARALFSLELFTPEQIEDYKTTIQIKLLQHANESNPGSSIELVSNTPT